jgi:hypothetical protein
VSKHKTAWIPFLCIAATPMSVCATSRAATQLVGRDLYTLTLPTGLSSLNVQPAYQPAAGGQVVGSASGNSGTHAVLWNDTGTATDLGLANSGYTSTQANGTNGSQQVGSGNLASGAGHALLWTNTGSIVDLAPTNLPGVTNTGAIAIGGNQIVGISADSAPQALLWNGASNVATNLNPSQFGINDSYALATDGQHQVGYGWATNGINAHAFLWTGSAASAVDLNPSGFTFTRATGVGNGQQVGNGFGSPTAGADHALLWTGTAASVVDLNPSGFGSSVAFATNGTWQVGWGPLSGGNPHALLWEGSAASYVDLQSLLPSGFTQSQAFSVDSSGNIFGLAFDSAGKEHAVEWSVPEPSGPSLMLGIAALKLFRRSRRIIEPVSV